MGTFFIVKRLVKVAALAVMVGAALPSCEKESYTECYWNSFSSTTCDTLPDGRTITIVAEKWSSDYAIPSEECAAITKRRLAELSGVFILNGKEVPKESLIYCDCR